MPKRRSAVILVCDCSPFSISISSELQLNSCRCRADKEMRSPCNALFRDKVDGSDVVNSYRWQGECKYCYEQIFFLVKSLILLLNNLLAYTDAFIPFGISKSYRTI